MGPFQKVTGRIVSEIQKEIMSRSESETVEIGRKIGTLLAGGEMILLKGPLGAGKSVIARGIARGLGITVPVRSPSFNLMREYVGRLVLRHWDLYRIESGFDELGLAESLDENSAVIVEWADKWSDLIKWASGSIFLDYGENEMERWIRFEGSIPGMD